MQICITPTNGVILLLLSYLLGYQAFAGTEFVVLSRLPLEAAKRLRASVLVFSRDLIALLFPDFTAERSFDAGHGQAPEYFIHLFCRIRQIVDEPQVIRDRSELTSQCVVTSTGTGRIPDALPVNPCYAPSASRRQLPDIRCKNRIDSKNVGYAGNPAPVGGRSCFTPGRGQPPTQAWLLPTRDTVGLGRLIVLYEA